MRTSIDANIGQLGRRRRVPHTVCARRLCVRGLYAGPENQTDGEAVIGECNPGFVFVACRARDPLTRDRRRRVVSRFRRG